VRGDFKRRHLLPQRSELLDMRIVVAVAATRCRRRCRRRRRRRRSRQRALLR